MTGEAHRRCMFCGRVANVDKGTGILAVDKQPPTVFELPARGDRRLGSCLADRADDAPEERSGA